MIETIDEVKADVQKGFVDLKNEIVVGVDGDYRQYSVNYITAIIERTEIYFTPIEIFGIMDEGKMKTFFKVPKVFHSFFKDIEKISLILHCLKH